MKILSFDVGIKNLAYCLINKDNDNFKIEDWGIINLDDDRKKCSSVLKKNKICNKTAMYSCIIDKKVQYLCKKCKNNYIEPVFDILENSDDGGCLYQNKNNVQCKKKATCSIKSVEGHYCNNHAKMVVGAKLRSLAPKKMADQNCNKIPIQTLAIKLFDNLDKKHNFLTANEILIENQPTFLNPTMKTISAILYSYFCLRGIHEKKLNNSNIESVKFFSPSNKLKVNTEHTNNLLNIKKEPEDTKAKKVIYDITKNLGKSYCTALIKEDVEKYEYLKNQAKTDDLCDSFLQAFFYLFCKNESMPEKYKNILDNVAKEVNTVEKLKSDNKKNKKNKKLSPKNKLEKKEIIVKGKKK
ncbi:hypothetical protein Catovirus_2_291 [Catovirus CTV1]|uniref:Mitochondrial resolvase Ydc2 catalytic domain-containing protein n=1 Tax=Catovirus CTV1 TaxID=1977631 RepID=A0A1V0SCA8_9VIRU|nr:hypothetical protein Catovirus_2_291 [Catovirus CTV1]